mgnify:CR=1 FL=1
METKVKKWGNSLGIIIPNAFAKETAIEAGSLLELSVVDGKLIIIPRSRPKYTLDELLDKIEKENIPEQVDFGKPAGKEIW